MFSACNRVAGRRTRTVYLYPPCTAYIHVLEVSARSRTVVGPMQTAFLPGTNIMEGVVILHETIHELHTKK